MYWRLVAAAAEEGKGTSQDTTGFTEWVDANVWTIVSSPGWALAWESALAGGNPNPGSDDAVITDGMILSAVQPLP